MNCPTAASSIESDDTLPTTTASLSSYDALTASAMRLRTSAMAGAEAPPMPLDPPMTLAELESFWMAGMLPQLPCPTSPFPLWGERPDFERWPPINPADTEFADLPRNVRLTRQKEEWQQVSDHLSPMSNSIGGSTFPSLQRVKSAFDLEVKRSGIFLEFDKFEIMALMNHPIFRAYVEAFVGGRL